MWELDIVYALEIVALALVIVIAVAMSVLVYVGVRMVACDHFRRHPRLATAQLIREAYEKGVRAERSKKEVA